MPATSSTLLVVLISVAPCSALTLVPSAVRVATPQSSKCSSRAITPRMIEIEQIAPLLVLPVVFVGAQTLAEMGSDKIAPGVDLQPKTAEELEKDPPKPLTSFLPDWMPGGGGGDKTVEPVDEDSGNDFYARREGEPVKFFPSDQQK